MGMNLLTDFSVYLVTWNVAGKEPPKDLTKLLKLDSPKLPNLYAIGIQEMDVNPGSYITDSIYDDAWTNTLTEVLGKRNYVRMKSVRLFAMHLVVYVKRQDIQYITNVESEYTRTGFGGFFGNKGGVSIRMDIAGINVCFVNCHFAAHLNNTEQRLQDYMWILEDHEYRDTDVTNILDHDYVFWIGDLNFRLDDIPYEEVVDRIKGNDRKYLEQFDQLKKLMKEELIFLDFEEGPLSFDPTYKFDKKTDNYDTSSKKRKPGWCDRILWLCHEDAFEETKLNVTLTSYKSLPEYKESDHKPVIAHMNIKVLKFPPELPVFFAPISMWCRSQSLKFTYQLEKNYEKSSSDWIGLYRADFKHPHDYLTYIWATGDALAMKDGSKKYSVTFPQAAVEDRLGPHCLCYFSHYKNCIIGYSDTFKITLTEDSDMSSSSDE